MNYSFYIIGGDLRNLRLAELLALENNNVSIYGFENYEKINELKKINIIQKFNNFNEDFNKKEKIIIGPIPFSKDNKSINMPYSNKKIEYIDFFEKNEEKIILAGGISDKIKKEAIDYKVNLIDLMQDEALIIYNTIATAEGAIKLIIENTENNIQDCKILILGFGRVAKTVAQKLKGLDAQITIAARKKQDLVSAEVNGYKATNINELKENLYQYEVIINTVPAVILTKERINYINQKCFILDLASFPGGIDKIEAEKRKIKNILALGIPGKVAPFASAKYIKNTIYNFLATSK